MQYDSNKKEILFFPPVFLRAINTFIYSHEMIRLPIKQLCPPNIELIIDNRLGSEPSFRVMAVAVAVLGPEDMTFILCVSTPQDTVSCKVSIFIHWVYCFQQKIPLPNATTSWWGEESKQAKCQGMCPFSLCFCCWCNLLVALQKGSEADLWETVRAELAFPRICSSSSGCGLSLWHRLERSWRLCL